MFHRTLMVGLGGTGIHVLRKFKNQFLKFYDREQRYVRLLGIDTASQEETEAPKLENHEFLHLGNPVVTSAQIAAWKNSDPFRWMPPDLPPFQISDGAGQRRLVGHIAYFWRGSDIAARIQSAMSDLYQADVSREFEGIAEGGNTRVFVVSSLCGGTGTGMFLDIGYLINHIFLRQGFHTSRLGFLFLPSAFVRMRNDPQFRNLQANGYAALQELNYYMQDMMEQGELHAPLREEPKIPIYPKPFNVCFLVGSPDEKGKMLPDVHSLYDRTAEFLFAAVAFPQIQAQLVDYLAVNGRQSYASFGSFSVPLPKARYVERYMLRIGHELLEDVFTPTPATDYSTSLTSVLAGSGNELLSNMENLQPLRDIEQILREQVFVRNSPNIGNQRAATEAIEHEYQHWMTLRGQQLQKTITDATEIFRTIEGRIEEERKRIWSLDRGSLASLQSLQDAAIAYVDSMLTALGVTTGAKTESEVYSEFQAAPGVFGIGGKSAVDRIEGFRFELTAAARSQMAGECRSRVRMMFGQLRGKLVDNRSRVAKLLVDGKVTIAEFDTHTERFLGERRTGGNAAKLLNTRVGQSNIDSTQFEVDRIGLLQRCRAKLRLDALIDAKCTVDLPRFVELLYGQTNEYVSDRVSTVQLLDQESLKDGLNQAWTNLSIQQAPNASRWVSNNLFAPNDEALRAQIREIAQNWPGFANGVHFQDPVDNSILSFLRVVGQFVLDDITEVRLLKQAYDAKMQTPDDAFFLRLPTHRTYEVMVENQEAEKSRRYALAVCSEVLKDFGQAMIFAGERQQEIADPVSRRRAMREMLLNPDRWRKVQRALDKLRDGKGTNLAYADDLFTRLDKHYPEDECEDPETEIDYMKAEERQQMLNYLATLGVKKYAAAGGFNG
jgi:hypothetical protein